ncbi:ADP-ribose pyrophosphatase YjhB, NUDIX family [Amycolatopsis arida]|uniref:ADP-ribose pyrophosphatase YjhB, NUDIX family n=1 Tax=Amycolatopsis arida TaxID=587909 RepID=A0A1I6AGA4_9PSEU|nr:NUDIX domain-containing protein [Amycolatopsis arida]TDX97716.1 ADP-ribose pyrophosphatase YjhB (NUDIX family) [Amycolatopsis arida]SFQ67700.1 ADP-ribose pyrophosphatase YjhB, NUDIX family [Amycolatopsis arida]
MIDSLAWIFVRDRRLLGVRTRGRAKFYLPGGKREEGESDVAGLCREIREELGVELDPLSFRLFAVFDERADGYADGRRVHMTAYRAAHRGEFVPGREIAELAWLSSADAPRCPPAGRRALRLLAESGEVD